MAETPVSSSAHFRVTLSGGPFDIPGAFATMEGGNRSGEPRRTREGGSPDEDVSGTPPSRDDITLGRPWRRSRDQELAVQLDRVVMRARWVVTKQPLDEDYKPYGDPMVYPDCLLTGCTHPPVDADAVGDSARLGLTLAPSGELA